MPALSGLLPEIAEIFLIVGVTVCSSDSVSNNFSFGVAYVKKSLTFLLLSLGGLLHVSVLSEREKFGDRRGKSPLSADKSHERRKEHNLAPGLLGNCWERKGI